MKSTNPVRVLVCDDEPRLRELIQAHWEEEDRVEIVGEASDGVEGVAAAARLQPDAILLDWYMPRLTGVEALPHLKRVAPDAAAVMWSSDVSPTAEATAQAAGGDCFLPKVVPLEELTAAVIDTAAARRRTAPPLKVLVAHECPGWRAQACTTLDRVGARVREAGSAEATVEAWHRHRPTVALVDKRFVPSLPLAELCVYGTAMVVVDGEIELEEALTALEAGTYDYLLMDPASPPEIASRVHAASDAGRLRDQVASTAAHLAQLAALSQTDELTGLANRRSLLDQLTALTSIARRHTRQLAVAVVDIDRFKAINDAHGHQAGDEILREVGRRLVARVREEDLVGRLGGDEFLLLLPEVDRHGAATVADALRDAIESRPLQIKGHELTVTVSVGWAAWQGKDDEDLLDRADRALYAAKHSRPDRIGGAARGD